YTKILLLYCRPVKFTISVIPSPSPPFVVSQPIIQALMQVQGRKEKPGECGARRPCGPMTIYWRRVLTGSETRRVNDRLASGATCHNSQLSEVEQAGRIAPGHRVQRAACGRFG